MLLAPIRGTSHAKRLESFYSGQAEGYDAFRSRLLYGRRELWTQLPVPEHGIWVDMGGGTGSNVIYVEAALQQLARLYIVDLSPSLLRMARQRIQAQGWAQVTAVEADATRFVPPEGLVDVVTFTYALTMIPDWFAALDHAWQLLRPGGLIGVVDFYVSHKYPAPHQRRHTWLTRAFWPLWFSLDNVFPSPDHVPYLHDRFEVQTFSEHMAPVPYLPGIRVPYYLFIGQKPCAPTDTTVEQVRPHRFLTALLHFLPTLMPMIPFQPTRR
jgi:S-adenosylmethionine-diacylgycerolhomoserine-N-methlytransferase